MLTSETQIEGPPHEGSSNLARLATIVWWAAASLLLLIVAELISALVAKVSAPEHELLPRPVLDASREDALIKKYREEVVAKYVVYDPVLGMRFLPGSRAVALEPDAQGKPAIARGRFLAIDRFGLVAHTSTPDPAKDWAGRVHDDTLFRVLVTGGSTTAGWGATDNEHTWPALLEALLREQLPALRKGYTNVAVINTGVFDYGLSQEMNRYLLETAYLNPQVVVCFDGINERWDYSGNPVDYAVKPYQFQMLGPANGLAPPRLFPYLQRLGRRMMGANSDQDVLWGFRVEGYVAGRTSAYFVRKSREFNGICAADDALFIHCLQPVMGVGEKRLTPHEESLKQYMGSAFYPDSWDVYETRARKFYREVKPAWNEPFQVDLSGVFDAEKETVYFDPRHYNDLGNQLIAEAILREIVARMASQQSQ